MTCRHVHTIPLDVFQISRLSGKGDNFGLNLKCRVNGAKRKPGSSWPKQTRRGFSGIEPRTSYMPTMCSSLPFWALSQCLCSSMGSDSVWGNRLYNEGVRYSGVALSHWQDNGMVEEVVDRLLGGKQTKRSQWTDRGRSHPPREQ